jgi:pyruvate dehydrogenase E2 component (dihydrolipoamide acetyltransferase)
VSLEKLTVPDLGDSEAVEVIEVLVSPGDQIQENDSLVVLETDKAAMEIPATSSGTVKEVLVKVGDTVSQGHEIVLLEASGDGSGESADSTDNTEESVEVKAEATQSEEKSEAEAEATEEPASSEEADIAVPDLGTDEAVEIIDILVAVGDEVNVDDGLITLETDKAAMDVPAPFAGKITDIKISVGDKVTTGSVIMSAQTSAAPKVAAASGSDTAPQATAAPEETKESKASESQTKPSASSTPASSTPTQSAPVSTKDNSEVYAGPAVRKLARELGVDLTQVSGTGTKNRILKEDVHDYVKNLMQNGGASTTAGGAFSLPTVKDIDFSQFGEIEEVDMSKLHQVTARNMAQNWLTIPHVTQFEEADLTDLEDFRAAQKALSEKKGIKLSPLPFIVKACAQALQEFPQFNVSLHSSGTKYIQKKYIHIGVAVATPAGLMVPVVKNVDQKSVWDIAAEVAELSNLAKERKLTKELMEGGCFTVSSLGNLGGVGFTPIVNAPEVAILGVSKTVVKPVWMNNEFVPRKILPFSLSYDHRAVNGVDGGLFCNYLNNLLSDIRLMVL